MQYNKPPLTYLQQITLMQSRGLTVPDVAKAQKYLCGISYYRLSAYALPFQQVKDTFNNGTTFQDVLNLYLFDKELRLIAFDAIERIEVAIRTQIIYSLSHKYGSHWQDDRTIFKPAYKIKSGKIIDPWQDIQNTIRDNFLSKYPEVFIKHYRDNYTKPPTPPSWMAIELLTMGQLSRLYKGLVHNQDKKEIADHFGLHHTLFESWIHALTYGRNLCAHHSRFWNRDFLITADIPRKNPALPWFSFPMNNNRRCFYFLSVIKYLLQTTNPSGHYKRKITELIQKYPNTPIQFMGIPSDGKGNLINWQNEPLWQK